MKLIYFFLLTDLFFYQKFSYVRFLLSEVLLSDILSFLPALYCFFVGVA